MTRRIIYIAMVLIALVTPAKAQRLAGTVTDSLGTPIGRATITEIDANHRVLSHTRSDMAGNFNMMLRNREQTRLRITADGYAIYTERCQNIDKRLFVLSPKTESRLTQLEKAHPGEKRNYVLTQKLFYGKQSAQKVPWMVMVELIGDSTIVLRLPVRSSSMSGTYVEGRNLIFADSTDGQMLISYNGKDTAPVTGLPNEHSTWKFVIDNNYTASEMRRGYSEEYDEQYFYYYPPFILSLDEMEHLLNDGDRLVRLLIDTEKADNCWVMYPTKGFVKEMQKILAKLRQ